MVDLGSSAKLLVEGVQVIERTNNHFYSILSFAANSLRKAKWLFVSHRSRRALNSVNDPYKVTVTMQALPESDLRQRIGNTRKLSPVRHSHTFVEIYGTGEQSAIDHNDLFGKRASIGKLSLNWSRVTTINSLRCCG